MFPFLMLNLNQTMQINIIFGLPVTTGSRRRKVRRRSEEVRRKQCEKVFAPSLSKTPRFRRLPLYRQDERRCGLSPAQIRIKASQIVAPVIPQGEAIHMDTLDCFTLRVRKDGECYGYRHGEAGSNPYGDAGLLHPVGLQRRRILWLSSWRDTKQSIRGRWIASLCGFSKAENVVAIVMARYEAKPSSVPVWIASLCGFAMTRGGQAAEMRRIFSDDDT
jgi:hypothetical protein